MHLKEGISHFGHVWAKEMCNNSPYVIVGIIIPSNNNNYVAICMTITNLQYVLKYT